MLNELVCKLGTSVAVALHVVAEVVLVSADNRARAKKLALAMRLRLQAAPAPAKPDVPEAPNSEDDWRSLASTRREVFTAFNGHLSEPMKAMFWSSAPAAIQPESTLNYIAVLCATFSLCSAQARSEAMERNKRERFVELGEARVRKATQMLRLIGNLSNTSNYEYTQEDAQKILAALDGELKLLRAKFQAALARRAKDDFKLG